MTTRYRTARRAARLGLQVLEGRDVPTTIQGAVFDDLNGNAARDAGEPGLAGWTLFVDNNRNGVLDPGEVTAVTDADGHYLFDTSAVPPFVTPNGIVRDYVALDLQVGSGGRWLNTTASFAVIDRNAEPDSTRDFGVSFRPYGPFQPVGAEHLVNADPAGQQGPGPILNYGRINLAVAADAAGNYVAAWRTYVPGGTDSIFARVFNADGSPRTGDILVATAPHVSEYGVITRVAVAGNGRFVVGWRGYDNAKNEQASYVRAYRADGSAAGSSVRVGGELEDIAADGSGNFVAAYNVQAFGFGSRTTLKVQRYTAAGATNGGAISVVTPTTIGGARSVAMDGAGNFVAVWDDSGVYAQRYTAAGKKRGQLITVASSSTAGPGTSSVGMNAAGRFAVAWHEAGPTEQKVARVYNPDGTAATGPVVFATAVPLRFQAAVAVDAAGNATFAWTDWRQPTPGILYIYNTGEVRLRQLSAAGVLSPEAIANTTTQGYQVRPGVAATGAGSFVVGWQGHGPGDDHGNFAQHFAPPPAPLTVVGTPATPTAGALAAAQAKPLLAEALRRWGLAGANVAQLGPINLHIADLPGATLGQAQGRTITLDANAAGWGWFVDRTPQSDSEFRGKGEPAAKGKIDLLSVLLHEVGHLLGNGHESHGVMAEALLPGVRELPDEMQSPRWGVDVRPKR